MRTRYTRLTHIAAWAVMLLSFTCFSIAMAAEESDNPLAKRFGARDTSLSQTKNKHDLNRDHSSFETDDRSFINRDDSPFLLSDTVKINRDDSPFPLSDTVKINRDDSMIAAPESPPINRDNTNIRTEIAAQAPPPLITLPEPAPVHLEFPMKFPKTTTSADHSNPLPTLTPPTLAFPTGASPTEGLAKKQILTAKKNPRLSPGKKKKPHAMAKKQKKQPIPDPTDPKFIGDLLDEEENANSHNAKNKVAFVPENTVLAEAKLLKNAYEALGAGQQEVAMALYEQLLLLDPHNQTAQLSLASLYQQENNLERAKELYREVLTATPHHRAALNNFLVLISRDSPEKAIAEFSKLEQVRPQDSTIPAQIAMIYAQQKDYMNGAKFMRKAVAIDAENTAYIYNLALMLDRGGERDQATRLYRQLVDAKRRGKTLPVSLGKISQRLAMVEK